MSHIMQFRVHTSVGILTSSCADVYFTITESGEQLIVK
jgi:hypothetical protein